MTVQTVAVIGAGTMGHGLAVQFARHDLDVSLVDHRESNLDRARERIRDVVTFLRAEGLTDARPGDLLDAIEFTVDVERGISDASLVLETASEDLATKRALFEAIADAAPDDAVLASNTSGIPITDIATAVDRPDRVVGCHWWNPPYLLSPVEVVRGEATSDDTFERTVAFVESVDREPIRVEVDVPGFVWNRIQFAVVREATHLVASGVASLEDVERAVRDGYATRTAAVGPFETMDLSGLDLFETVASELYPHLCDDEEPNDLFADYRTRGNGVEDGVGFFEYDGSPGEAARRRDERVAAVRRSLDG